MKFTKSDFKTVVLFFVSGVILFLALYAGKEYDIPVLNTAHEGAGG